MNHNEGRPVLRLARLGRLAPGGGIAASRRATDGAVLPISTERLAEHLARLALIDGAIRAEDRWLDGFVGDEEEDLRTNRRGPGRLYTGSPRRARALVLSRMAEEGMPLGRWVEHGKRALCLRVTPEGAGHPRDPYDLAGPGASADGRRYELLEVSRSAARRAPAGQDPKITVEAAKLRKVSHLQLAGAAALCALYAPIAALPGPSPHWGLPAILGGLSLLLAWGTFATVRRLRELHAAGPTGPRTGARP